MITPKPVQHTFITLAHYFGKNGLASQERTRTTHLELNKTIEKRTQKNKPSIVVTKNPISLTGFELILGALLFTYIIVTLSLTIHNGRSKYGFAMLVFDIIVYCLIWKKELILFFDKFEF